MLLRKISEVSGGEAQRVALARALATNPKLLLLDEPLSALDLQLRERLQTEIRRIQRKLKITTIYVTHSQDEAFAISDRVAILDDGIVSQVGTPEELYDSPVNAFVARFLGSGNVFSGLISEVFNGNLRVIVDDTLFEIPGEGEIDEKITFSVKPEDVIISDSQPENWTQAGLVSRPLLSHSMRNQSSLSETDSESSPGGGGICLAPNMGLSSGGGVMFSALGSGGVSGAGSDSGSGSSSTATRDSDSTGGAGAVMNN